MKRLQDGALPPRACGDTPTFLATRSATSRAWKKLPAFPRRSSRPAQRAKTRSSGTIPSSGSGFAWSLQLDSESLIANHESLNHRIANRSNPGSRLDLYLETVFIERHGVGVGEVNAGAVARRFVRFGARISPTRSH